MRHLCKLTSSKRPWTCTPRKWELSCHVRLFHRPQQLVPLPRWYLEALGLLPDLHDVLAPQLPLPALVVFQLVGELGLVLQSDQLAAHLLDGAEVAELQLLHGLVLAQQHGVLQVLLCLPFVQLLAGGQRELLDSLYLVGFPFTTWHFTLFTRAFLSF